MILTCFQISTFITSFLAFFPYPFLCTFSFFLQLEAFFYFLFVFTSNSGRKINHFLKNHSLGYQKFLATICKVYKVRFDKDLNFFFKTANQFDYGLELSLFWVQKKRVQLENHVRHNQGEIANKGAGKKLSDVLIYLSINQKYSFHCQADLH